MDERREPDEPPRERETHDPPYEVDPPTPPKPARPNGVPARPDTPAPEGDDTVEAGGTLLGPYFAGVVGSTAPQAAS